MAEAMLRNGEVGGALDEVKARVTEAPGDVIAHELLIDILTSTDRGDLARDLYKGLAQQNAGQADFLYLLGRAHPTAIDSRDAFEAALAIDRDHARSWMGLGAVYRAAGSWGEAAAAYREALQRDTSLSEAWIGLRSSLLSAGDVAGAEKAARDQIATFPQALDGWIALTEIRSGQRVAVWQEAVAASPGQPVRKIHLARAAFEEGQLDLAAATYKKAIAEDAPDVSALRAELAILNEVRAGALDVTGATRLLQVRLIARSDVADAAKVLDDLARSFPHSGWVRLVRGNVRRSAGQTTSAEDDLRAALDRMPNSPEAWSALGLYLLDQQRPAEARPLLDKAAAARSRDVSIVVAAAMAAGQAGAVKEADAMLGRAILAFPTSSGPVLGLARLRLTNGDVDGAFTVLTTSLRLAPDVAVAYALVSAAQEANRPDEAIQILSNLARDTGDARFARAAKGLRQAQESKQESTP
jgi:tetratricopeptide (TPR) repeat protein